MNSKEQYESAMSRLARHLHAKFGDKLPNPFAVAEGLLASRKPPWVAFFLAVSQTRNTFHTKRELADIAGITKAQCDEYWSSLSTMTLRKSEGLGEVPVFSKDYNLQRRLSGTVNGTAIVGGVYLHLAQHGRTNREVDRAVIVTTKGVTQTWAENFRGATTREAGASGSIEERAENESVRDEVLTGVKAGPSNVLPLLDRKSA